MPSDGPSAQTEPLTAEEMATVVGTFDQQPFWKQVAVLAAGLFWYGATRYLIPAGVVALVVHFVL